MTVEFEFNTDEDTVRLLEIAAHFLEQYFGHSREEAISLINRYYKMREAKHDDDYYHHEGAFHIAVQVHYFVHLSGDEGRFPAWKREHNLKDIPIEAIDYFREHYFRN